MPEPGEGRKVQPQSAVTSIFDDDRRQLLIQHRLDDKGRKQRVQAQRELQQFLDARAGAATPVAQAIVRAIELHHAATSAFHNRRSTRRRLRDDKTSLRLYQRNPQWVHDVDGLAERIEGLQAEFEQIDAEYERLSQARDQQIAAVVELARTAEEFYEILAVVERAYPEFQLPQRLSEMQTAYQTEQAETAFTQALQEAGIEVDAPVRALAGRLEGFSGVVTGIDPERQAVRVVFTIFGRQTQEQEYPVDQLERKTVQEEESQ